MKGFSRANLLYMRAFAAAWPDEPIVQQAVGHLPWGHNLVLLSKLKDRSSRLAYAARAVEHGWSRNVLSHQIEGRLLEREGRAVTNFEARLPAPGFDLARSTLKDPYLFDFLGIGTEADERAIVAALVRHTSVFCSSWAPASPSSGSRSPSKWAAMTSSSTCSSITSSCGAMSSWS